MFATLRQRNFALLWFAGLISLIGDWMLMIGLPIYVYILTRSTLATSTMFIAEIVPRLALGSVAGVFVDRWNRKRIMVITNLLLALGLLPLLLLHSIAWLWVVYGVALLDAASFLIAAMLITLIALDARVVKSSTASDTLANPWIRVWREWLAGLRLIKQERNV